MPNKSLSEKILLISIIGTLESIKEGGLTIAEAEKFLFSPYMIKRLKEEKLNDSIIDILEKGCELEDIASLLPEYLVENLDEMKHETLKKMKNYAAFEQKFWI